MIQVRIDSEELTLSFEEWEARVRAGRIPPDAQILFEPTTGDRWVRAEELEMYTSLRNDAALAWRSQFTTSGPPLLTALLVGIQIRLWWVQWWTPEAEGFLVEHLILFAPSVLENGEAWRLVTMGFAHTAAFHLALNMLWLVYCGWNLERALGRANLLLLYMASVVVGSLLSMYATPESPSLGASGGVYGLVAASVVYGFIWPNLLPEKGRRLFGWALLPYLVLMLASGLMSEGIDNWSHLGGLLTGGALAAILDPPPLQRRPRWNQKIYAVATAGILFVFVVFAVSGPHLIRLIDSHEARSSSRSGRAPPAVYQDRALQWAVPAGWRGA